MTLSEFVVAWLVVSVAVSLALGRMFAQRDTIERILRDLSHSQR